MIHPHHMLSPAEVNGKICSGMASLTLTLGQQQRVCHGGMTGKHTRIQL